MSTYIAVSGISMNVKLKSGYYRHVCFELQSNGMSIFCTRDKGLIEALDGDERRGVLYEKEEEGGAVARERGDAAQPSGKAEGTGAKRGERGDAAQPWGGGEGMGGGERGGDAAQPWGGGEGMGAMKERGAVAQGEAGELEEVRVECFDDAKEYLVETFGVPRTAVKKKADVLHVAEMNGVRFVGDWN